MTQRRIQKPEYHVIEKLKREHVEIGGLRINFQRTCRVPEGKLNSLPAGLGSFPIYKVSDFKSGCPKEWREDGYFLPMYTQEAMWMHFSSYNHYAELQDAMPLGPGCFPYPLPGSRPRPQPRPHPRALIVGAGNINAISGKPFITKGKGKLDVKLEGQQNYLVVPPQPWLDGWKAEDGKVYQFVAAKMGSGETVEGQITGEETVGGLQLIVYAPKKGKELVIAPRPYEHITKGSWSGLEAFCLGDTATFSMRSMKAATSMGLGRGGEISQKIYPDPYGVEVWDEMPAVVDIVYLISSEDFQQVTGHPAPATPVTYEKYQELGLPWFELYDKHYADTQGSDVFGTLKPVGKGKEKGAKKEDPLGKLKPKKKK